MYTKLLLLLLSLLLRYYYLIYQKEIETKIKIDTNLVKTPSINADVLII